MQHAKRLDAVRRAMGRDAMRRALRQDATILSFIVSTVLDIALHCLARFTLEPIYEAVFHPNVHETRFSSETVPFSGY